MAVISSEVIHAACVAMDGRGVLIESRDPQVRTDLVLRMIDRGGTLVADAQTNCVRQERQLYGSPVSGRAGRIEVRGIGDVRMEFAERVPISLLLVLLDPNPRFAEEYRTRSIAGVDVAVLPLAADDPAAPIKAELWLKER